MKDAHVFLIVDYTGEHRAIEYFLPHHGELLVGRSKEADIQLDIEGVSRRHFLLTHDGEHAFIEDLGSRNGTILNQEPLTARVRLRDGDRIMLGGHLLIKVSVCQPEPHVLDELAAGGLVISQPYAHHVRPVMGRPDPPAGVKLDELLELCRDSPRRWRICASGRTDAFVVMDAGEIIAAQCGPDTDRVEAFIGLLSLPDSWVAVRDEHTDRVEGTPWEAFIEKVHAKLEGGRTHH